jgi:regulator of protease activity HflC (stomatin/prohibitin superfamily)
MPPIRIDQWLFGCLVAACFPILVLERQLSATRLSAVQPLSLLLRMLLGNLLFFGVGFLLRWLQIGWWLVLDHAAALFTALVAAEILLRAVSYFFMPLPPLEARRGYVESLVAGLLRLQRPSLATISASISREVGIDLGRSWALGFIRRAALPAAVGLTIAGWLMTSLTALDLSQRAVYEGLGVPKAVFHSGLHIHLPWPLGRLRLVEYGAVHEIPIVFPVGTGGQAEAGTAPANEVATIEGAPPQTAERLWDASHPSEASYLVASNRNGRETFEVVNIDLQILYRVGLSDQAAYDAVYNVEAPDNLIRAAAGRMLARYFARYTIPDVLGQNREQFIRGFQRELQTRLDALSAGIDILGVVVEGIHPPAEAASAYQDVQAAGIRSEIQIATTRGEAARSILKAQAEATARRNDAQANSSEAINQAKRDTALFAGDVTAYHENGAAFLFERRLQAIGRAVTPDMAVTILDSHIPANQLPTLDLRPAGSANTPTNNKAAAAADND